MEHSGNTHVSSPHIIHIGKQGGHDSCIGMHCLRAWMSFSLPWSCTWAVSWIPLLLQFGAWHIALMGTNASSAYVVSVCLIGTCQQDTLASMSAGPNSISYDVGELAVRTYGVAQGMLVWTFCKLEPSPWIPTYQRICLYSCCHMQACSATTNSSCPAAKAEQLAALACSGVLVCNGELPTWDGDPLCLIIKNTGNATALIFDLSFSGKHGQVVSITHCRGTLTIICPHAR